MIGNETSGEENRTDVSKQRATTKGEPLKDSGNETGNKENLNQSDALKPITNSSNSELTIDFDYDKFMQELKSSHQKLSELNKALKNNENSTGIIDSGIICFYYLILFLI